MDPKTKKKMEKEMKKMRKKDLREKCEVLAEQHSTVQRRIAAIEKAKSNMETDLFKAIDANDNSTIEIIKSKMTYYKEELDRLTKREKTLAEETELFSKGYEERYSGDSSMWGTVGAWIVGLGSAVISGYGIVKSHKSFNDGSMVDKGTKNIAEKISGIREYLMFWRH